MDSVDENQPLLKNVRQEQQDLQYPDSHVKKAIEKEGGIGKLVFTVMLLGIFLSMACESLVAATHEEIASAFNALSLAPWLFTAYSVGYSMMLPLYGSLIDLYGCKNTLLLSYGTFGTGCIMTGCALSMGGVIAGRFVASLGGAGIVDIVSILLNRGFRMIDVLHFSCRELTEPGTSSLSQVAVLRSYIFVAATLGISIGSPLGGVLMNTIGWRWSFITQCPIIFLCLAITAVQLESDSPRNTPHSTGILPFEVLSHLDIWGYLLLIVSLGSGLVALHYTGERGNDCLLLKVALWITCVASMALFVTVELNTKKSPVVPFRDMAKDGIGFICLGQVPLCVSQFSIISNATSYLVHVENATTAVASIPLIFYAFGAIAGALGSGHSVQRIKRCKLPSTISCIVSGISFTLILVRWRENISHWELSYTVLVGAGISALMSFQYIALSNRVPDSSASIITSYYLAQQIGTLVGTASSNGLFRVVFRRRLSVHLGESSEAQKIISGLLERARFGALLPLLAQEKIQFAFLESFQIIPGLCLVSMGLTIPFILAPKDITVD